MRNSLFNINRYTLIIRNGKREREWESEINLLTNKEKREFVLTYVFGNV